MMWKRLTLALLLSTSLTPAYSGTVRLKDLVEFDGVRTNDLIGYGLVVGLNGTGDGLRNTPFTEELMSNMLERLGVNVTGESLRPKNVAAVFVTAKLPPFARAGSDIDVTVSAIGDAKSLLGGTLVMTPLNAADGQVYAVAQGAIIADGVSAEGQAASVTQGVPTAGTIPSGATVEREVNFDFSELKNLRLALRDADFTTALKIDSSDYATQLATFSSVEQQVLANSYLENIQSALSSSSLASVADWIGKSAKVEGKLWFDGDPVKLEFELPFDATRGELVIQTQTGNEVFRTNVDPEDRTLHWSGTQSNGANVEHGSYKAILVPYNENDPLQNAPVFSFQKLIEAAQGNGVATLTLESGETIAPQNVIALR